MNTAFRKSFERDLKDLKKDHEMRRRIRKKIEEIEAASELGELASLKKLTGGENYYRIRVGDYRIGVVIEEETVIFVRCLHRREIYRYFP